jgi:hypothetical protein
MISANERSTLAPRTSGSHLRVALHVSHPRCLSLKSLLYQDVRRSPSTTVSASKHKRGYQANRTDMGQVSGCKVTADVSIGGFDLPAQSVIAAQELDGQLEQVGYFMR